MTLPVGTILKYKDYPHGIDGKIKPYWFVIFGRSSLLHQPQYYFMFKTTAQLHYYQPGGERKNNNFKFLECKHYSCFEQDSYLDFDLSVFDRHTVEELNLLIKTGKVEVKGQLDSVLVELYHLSIKGSGAPFNIKEFFHSTFNTDGVTGLKKPQKHDRDYYRNKYKR
jgi:hypothetical protein